MTTALLLLLVGAVIYFQAWYPDRYETTVQAQAARHSLDVNLVKGVIWSESKFRADAESKAGARGLMQLMEPTARECAVSLGMNPDTIDLFDAETSIRLGTYYLRYLLDKFGDERTAVMAYNAGEGNVAKWLEAGLSEPPFKETRQYVKRVLKTKKIYAFKSK